MCELRRRKLVRLVVAAVDAPDSVSFVLGCCSESLGLRTSL